MLDRIRAVFADAQTEGMDQLYDVINAARDLAPDSDSVSYTHLTLPTKRIV